MLINFTKVVALLIMELLVCILGLIAVMIGDFVHVLLLYVIWRFVACCGMNIAVVLQAHVCVNIVFECIGIDM